LQEAFSNFHNEDFEKRTKECISWAR